VSLRNGAAPRRLIDVLALEPNILRVSAAMLLLGLGENLWLKFVPKYLQALGAPVLAIGLYGTLRDLIDGLYQYPGGWLSDRLGRRAALMLLVSAAVLGYVIYALAPSWPFVYAGLLFVMAWASMASPTLFAVVGDALPRGRRVMGFTVQAILRRVPIAVAPAAGGALLVAWGTTGGMRIALAICVFLGLLTILVASRVRIQSSGPADTRNVRGVWRTFPQPLRALLLSDIFIRTCEGMVDVFLVLYAINVVGISATQFGLLIGIQTVTSIAVYLPAARIADRIGRKPFVIATFLAFSLFPLAVVFSEGMGGLLLAYVVAGLREIGEPARKALIVDLAHEQLRGRSVGLYYLIRSVAIAPAAFAGGLLWKIDPRSPFFTATVIGVIGTIIFAKTVSEEHAA
jgi:MFS family permease